MPSRKRRIAGALLAALSGLALSAQSPGPHGPGPHAPGQHAHAYPHAGSYRPMPAVIIYGSSATAPAATPAPKHRATPRPANAPEVFESHSTDQ